MLDRTVLPSFVTALRISRDCGDEEVEEGRCLGLRFVLGGMAGEEVEVEVGRWIRGDGREWKCEGPHWRI